MLHNEVNASYFRVILDPVPVQQKKPRMMEIMLCTRPPVWAH
jgi:hypothetical protein